MNTNNNAGNFEKYTKELLRMYRKKQGNSNNNVHNTTNSQPINSQPTNRDQNQADKERQIQPNNDQILRDDGINTGNSNITQNDDGFSLKNNECNNLNSNGELNDNNLYAESNIGDYYRIQDSNQNTNMTNQNANPGQFPNNGSLTKNEEEMQDITGVNSRNIDKSRFPINERSNQLEQNIRNQHQEKTYNSIEEFTAQNPSNGFIRAEVRSARGALPVQNARCSIYKDIGGQKHVFHDLVTNESGNTETVSVPAPMLEESFEPNGNRPYETYSLEVNREGFRPIVTENLSVFPGIVSIQPVLMNPQQADQNNQESDVTVEQRETL